MAFRPGVQIGDPRVVTLLLRGRGGLLWLLPRADQHLLDPGQLRFDSAQAAGDVVILSRHGRRAGSSRDCCRGCPG